MMQVEGKWALQKTKQGASSVHKYSLWSCVLMFNEEKDQTNLIHLTAIRFPVNLLIKYSRRRLSQVLRVSLGAEYINNYNGIIEAH